MKKNFLSGVVLFLCTTIFSLHSFAQQECKGFRTQTQGGWGAKPAGNNPGVYMTANFANAFPSGLVIGCGNNTLKLTNAQAVTDFLPSGSTPSALPAGNMVNPGGNYSNVLAGQLVTAILNTGFDAYDPNFSINTINTGNLVIASGTFAGFTINQLIAEANNTIGGCSSNYSFSALNDALTTFNENYDDGKTDNGHITCQVPCTISVSGTSKDANCHGDNSGSIDITVTGANGSITYLWNDGNTNEDRTALAAGSYSVTVKDSKGCESSTSFTISEPDALGASAITANITTVGGNDGSIDLTVTGGTKPYSYLWNDGNTDEDRTGLTAGTYKVTITDAHGCSTEASYTLKEPECNIAVRGNVSNVKCYADISGTIDITVTGANGLIGYLWNDGNTNEDRSGLPAGSYSVTVTDATKCTASASFTISQPAKRLAIKLSTTNTTAIKACDGTAQIKIVGGTAPYTVVWSDGYVGMNRTGMCRGTYTVTVTDANGCTDGCRIRIICSATVSLTSANSSALSVKNNSNISVFPNPAKSVTKLNLTSKTNATALMNIYDLSGKKISTEKFAVSAGTTSKNIDLSRYAKGMYNVEVIINGEKQQVKVAVQ